MKPAATIIKHKKRKYRIHKTQRRVTKIIQSFSQENKITTETQNCAKTRVLSTPNLLNFQYLTTLKSSFILCQVHKNTSGISYLEQTLKKVLKRWH